MSQPMHTVEERDTPATQLRAHAAKHSTSAAARLNAGLRTQCACCGAATTRSTTAPPLQQQAHTRATHCTKQAPCCSTAESMNWKARAKWATRSSEGQSITCRRRGQRAHTGRVGAASAARPLASGWGNGWARGRALRAGPQPPG